MPTKFTTPVLKDIVETKTNNAYTLISAEAKGSIDPKGGKRKKRRNEKSVRLNYSFLL